MPELQIELCDPSQHEMRFDNDVLRHAEHHIGGYSTGPGRHVEELTVLSSALYCLVGGSHLFTITNLSSTSTISSYVNIPRIVP